MKTSLALPLLAAVLMLSACGNKGPLVLPDKPADTTTPADATPVPADPAATPETPANPDMPVVPVTPAPAANPDTPTPAQPLPADDEH
jgi:predicted small lipoprotein YifL